MAAVLLCWLVIHREVFSLSVPTSRLNLPFTWGFINSWNEYAPLKASTRPLKNRAFIYTVRGEHAESVSVCEPQCCSSVNNLSHEALYIKYGICEQDWNSRLIPPKLKKLPVWDCGVFKSTKVPLRKKDSFSVHLEKSFREIWCWSILKMRPRIGVEALEFNSALVVQAWEGKLE